MPGCSDDCSAHVEPSLIREPVAARSDAREPLVSGVKYTGRRRTRNNLLPEIIETSARMGMGSLNPEPQRMPKELEEKLLAAAEQREAEGLRDRLKADMEDEDDGPISVSGEFQKLWSLAWPVCLSSLLQFFFQFVMMLFAGRLGPKNLAAVSLGNSFFNMVYYGMQGAATSLDTMIAQAHGQKKTKLCWVWCQRGMLLFIFFTTLACLLLYYAAPLFIYFGIDPELAHHSGEYLWWLIPGVPAFIYFILLQKYQMCMNVMAPSVWVCAIANVLNLIFCYLSNHLEYGTNGLAAALSLSRIVLLIMMIVVIRRFHVDNSPDAGEQNGVTGINDKEDPCNRKELLKMFRLAVAGAFMLGLECGAFEVTVFMAARLSVTALDAHNICLMFIGLCYLSMPLGISIASSIRVGNLLGAYHPRAAEIAAKLSIGMGTVSMFCFACVFYFTRNTIGFIFTDDAKTVATIAIIAPISAIFASFDGFQGVCSGVMRAMGRQEYNAWAIAIAFYPIGLPIGAYICFWLGVGVQGLWVGLAVGVFSMSVALGYQVFTCDWEYQCAKALRNQNSKVIID